MPKLLTFRFPPCILLPHRQPTCPSHAALHRVVRPAQTAPWRLRQPVRCCPPSPAARCRAHCTTPAWQRRRSRWLPSNKSWLAGGPRCGSGSGGCWQAVGWYAGCWSVCCPQFLCITCVPRHPNYAHHAPCPLPPTTPPATQCTPHASAGLAPSSCPPPPRPLLTRRSCISAPPLAEPAG